MKPADGHPTRRSPSRWTQVTLTMGFASVLSALVNALAPSLILALLTITTGISAITLGIQDPADDALTGADRARVRWGMALGTAGIGITILSLVVT